MSPLPASRRARLPLSPVSLEALALPAPLTGSGGLYSDAPGQLSGWDQVSILNSVYGANRTDVRVANGALFVTGTPLDDTADLSNDPTVTTSNSVQGTRAQNVDATTFTNIEFNGGGYDSFTNNSGESLLARGGDGADTLIGGSISDTLVGDMGEDALDGRGGNDVIWGDGTGQITGAAPDGANGSAMKDTVAGGDGDDYLYGGIGNDTVGADDDRFLAWSATDDRVTDPLVERRPHAVQQHHGDDQPGLERGEPGHRGTHHRPAPVRGRELDRGRDPDRRRRPRLGAQADRDHPVPQADRPDRRAGALPRGGVRPVDGGRDHGERRPAGGEQPRAAVQRLERRHRHRVQRLQLPARGGERATTVAHELAHNWDEESNVWADWRNASGWRDTAPPAAESAQFTRSGDGRWWFRNTANGTFYRALVNTADTYSTFNPLEDWSTAWEGYRQWKLGTLNATIAAAMANKFAIIDRLVAWMKQN